MKTEIVNIEGFYAIRRTYRRFGLFTTYKFANVTSSSSPKWYSRDYDHFHHCLSRDLEEVKELFARFGSDPGVSITANDIITPDELGKINKMAQTDEGIKDMLLKLKEFYLLRAK